jgi:hypothetical protein
VLLDENESLADIHSFVKKYKINFPISIGKTNQKFFKFLKINYTPYSILYDIKGNYFTHYNGAVIEEMIEFDIKNILK